MKVTTVLEGLLVLASCASAGPSKFPKCKCFPGDACWPSEREWSRFNATVGGRLMKTVPLGAPCHDPGYNAETCANLAAQWQKAPIHIDDPTSIQAAIFANGSCDPFTPRSSACQLGNYARYSVNVTGPSDIAKTIKFAREKNIRLVIRNTGHDYMGRSSGAGSLSIWTHNLKGIQVKDWKDPEYKGKALRLAAGSQGYEVGNAAKAAGLVAVTGECPTVGIAGGYTQSGGHSPLSSEFGLGADQTLEFEVVTADGNFVKANAFNAHKDLFWALSGSGAGNYGVVTAVTVKAHPDKPTSGASFTIADPNLNYADVLSTFHETLPGITDSGAQVTYLATTGMMVCFSVSGFGKTQADMEAKLAPFAADLKQRFNYTLEPVYTSHASYHDYYWHYYGPMPAGLFGGAGDQLMGGRFLLRDALPGVTPAILSEIMSKGVTFIGQALNVGKFGSKKAKRAVAPQWRDAVVMSAYSMPFTFDVPHAEMAARQDFITNEIQPLIEAVTPNAGAYINEADFQQPDWQEVFYGENYRDLLKVKKRYDPKGFFWNAIAVGGERWVVDEGTGRMCEA